MTKILVLATRGASTWMLVRELRRNFPSVQVVIEEKEATSTFMKRRLRHLGPVETIGQIAFLLYGKIAAISARPRTRACVANAGLNDRPIEDSECIVVDSVNDEKVRELIVALSPDAIVVSGTRIIRSRILEAADAKFINAHFGITPMYRGVHGGYWALAQGEAACCGVTVHLVDKGVDTGEILYQQTISPTSEDNFFTYPTLQAIAAIPLILQAVRDCLEGQLVTTPAVGQSRQWYHPTLWSYVRTGIRRGVW